MIYYVIYTIDKTGSVRHDIPTSMRHLLRITERWTEERLDDSQNELVKHRKLVGWLTQKQFDRFIQDTCLYAVKDETMGSITDDGHYNSVMFQYQDSMTGEVNYAAYVSPVPQKYKHNFVKRQVMSYKTWQQWTRVRDALVRKYK